MENPVILQFDNDDSYLTVADIICFNLGLTVKATAQNIDSTRHLIAQIEKKQLKPDIAIVADYLGYDFEDGRKLTEKLRLIAPELKIIAYVTDPETDWGDFLALKGNEQEHTLTKVLEQLTGKKFIASNLKEDPSN